MSNDDSYLIMGCSQAWVHDWGISAFKLDMSARRWFDECRRVSQYIGIEPEQNLGRYAERYAIRLFKHPLADLLCDILILWVLDYGRVGKQMVSLHFGNVGGHYTQAVRGLCDAMGEARAEAIKLELPAGEADAYVSDKTRRKMKAWWSESLARMTQATL